MLRMWTAIQSRLNDQEGAGLVEYVLLVAFIAVVAVLAITTFGTELASNYDEVASEL